MSTNKINTLLKKNVVANCYVQSISYASGRYIAKLSEYPDNFVKDFLGKLFGNIMLIW